MAGNHEKRASSMLPRAGGNTIVSPAPPRSPTMTAHPIRSASTRPTTERQLTTIPSNRERNTSGRRLSRWFGRRLDGSTADEVGRTCERSLRSSAGWSRGRVAYCRLVPRGRALLGRSSCWWGAGLSDSSEPAPAEWAARVRPPECSGNAVEGCRASDSGCRVPGCTSLGRPSWTFEACLTAPGHWRYLSAMHPGSAAGSWRIGAVPYARRCPCD